MSEVVYTACHRYKSAHLSHYRYITRIINRVSKKKLKENMKKDIFYMKRNLIQINFILIV